MKPVNHRAVTLAAALVALGIGTVIGASDLSSLSSGDGAAGGSSGISSIFGGGHSRGENSSDGPGAGDGKESGNEGGRSGDSDARTLDAALVLATRGDLTDALSGRPIVVLASSDADTEHIARIRDAVTEAGGIIAGQVDFTDKVADSEAAGELTSLVENLPLPGLDRAEDAKPAVALGRALGEALALDPQSGEQRVPTEDRATILTTLAETGYITYETGTVRPGQLVIVVAGTNGGENDSFATATAAIAARTDEVSAGAVLAAPQDNDRNAPAITVARKNATAGQASTIDNVNLQIGPVAAVLALREQLGKGRGDFGIGEGASAVLPPM